MRKWKIRDIIGKKKRPLFGLPLIERMTYEEEELNNFTQVPQLVANLVAIIAQMEPVQGVFRVNGSERAVKEIVSVLNTEKKLNYSKQSVFDLASLLKRYFRELPEPLFLCKNYAEFRRIAELNSEEEQVEQLGILIRALPPAHLATAKSLFHLLHHMSAIEEYSMNDKNLALVWSPNLIRPPPGDKGLPNHTQLSKCISIMIKNYTELFGSGPAPSIPINQKSDDDSSSSSAYSSCTEYNETDEIIIKFSD